MLSGVTKGSGGSSADPQSKLMELASGTHTVRVAADGPDKAKVSVLENAAEYSIIHNGNDVWAYDEQVERGVPLDGPRSRKGPGEGAEGRPDDAQAARRRGPEVGGRHDLRDGRRHGAGRGP